MELKSNAETANMAHWKFALENVCISRIHGSATKNIPHLTVVNIYNWESIRMAKDDESENLTKHVDIRYHLLYQLHAEKEFRIQYCPTSGMSANILSKPLHC